MGGTLSLKMSEVTIATGSRDSAQLITMQVSFELRTFLSFLTFLNLEWIPLIAIQDTSNLGINTSRWVG